MCLRGRATYNNLSRYSKLNEKTYRRWFGKKLAFIEFNRLGIHEVIPASHEKIAVLDASFMEKSGKKTDGLGKFYNSKQSKAEKGLEISTLAVIDVDYNTAYHVSTRQTPIQAKNAEETRVHEYLKHFKDDCHALPKDVRYLVTDAYYSKQTFTHGVLECGYHQIGKLRRDANLRYLFTGQQKPKGRHKLYDGKLIIGDISRLDFVDEHNGVKLYTAVVNSVNLKRTIRVVYVLKNTGYAVLFSTDTELDALTLYLYYKARFQIEFLFRDAKQFMGLNDCQARSEPALHSHFNACFTALNLIKWQDRLSSPYRKPTPLNHFNKARFFNALFIERISFNFGFDLSLIKSSPRYQELYNFGAVSG